MNVLARARGALAGVLPSPPPPADPRARHARCSFCKRRRPLASLATPHDHLSVIVGRRSVLMRVSVTHCIDRTRCFDQAERVFRRLGLRDRGLPA